MKNKKNNDELFRTNKMIKIVNFANNLIKTNMISSVNSFTVYSLLSYLNISNNKAIEFLQQSLIFYLYIVAT